MSPKDLQVLVSICKSASCAALAQLVEHIIRNDGVRCSSHLSGTISHFLTFYPLWFPLLKKYHAATTASKIVSVHTHSKDMPEKTSQPPQA
jgi:hypothetical protein